MIFTKEQIESLMEIIDTQSSLFIVSQMGDKHLSRFDKWLLGKYGFDIKKITQKYPPYMQSFMFGRLSGWLSNKQAGEINYTDFKTYLSSNQYFPLTEMESNMYDLATKRSYTHIKNLGIRMKDELSHQITEEDVRGELSGAINKRESITKIISNWGHKTGNWQRDYGRIADTEMNTIFQLGRAMSIEKKFGLDQEVFKNVYPGACRHCIRLYLKSGIGSEPIIFSLKKLLENGSNIGRRVSEWLAVVESTHPFCRCTLQHKPKGTEWDKEKKMYIYSDKHERMIERKSKIVIRVGSKKFEV